MGFVDMKVEITKEEYDRVVGLSIRAQNLYIEDVACASEYHPAGYGCYSPKLCKEQDTYYVRWGRALCCD